MKYIKYSSLFLLIILLPKLAMALAPNCNNEKYYTLLIISLIVSILAVIGIIFAIVRYRKYLKNKTSGFGGKNNLPIILFIIVALLLIIAIYLNTDLQTDGPLARRTDDCILGFDVYTKNNTAELDIDSLTNKTEVESLYNIIKHNPPRNSECIHLGTDGKHIVFEQVYCEWVEDAYPYFYNADGTRSYLSAKTLNKMQWDQTNLLDYFEIAHTQSNNTLQIGNTKIDMGL